MGFMLFVIQLPANWRDWQYAVFSPAVYSQRRCKSMHLKHFDTMLLLARAGFAVMYLSIPGLFWIFENKYLIMCEFPFLLGWIFSSPLQEEPVPVPWMKNVEKVLEKHWTWQSVELTFTIEIYEYPWSAEIAYFSWSLKINILCHPASLLSAFLTCKWNRCFLSVSWMDLMSSVW